MEIDIPLEELELLEANSHFEEEYLDLHPTDDEDDFCYANAQPNRPTPQSPSKSPPSTDPQIKGHKRLRPQTPDPPNHDNNDSPSDEKRSKVDNLWPDMDDEEEDWLRYSPPQESNREVEEEEVEIPQEKILSRYASEIDGGCIPITAPSGERVYAKICWPEREERVKKLDVQEQSNGFYKCC